MFGNRRLMKHVIATTKVLNFDLCELQCYHQPNCVSINFNVIPDSEGLHECELSNATHRGHDNELMNRDGYIYKGTEVRNLNLLLNFSKEKQQRKKKTHQQQQQKKCCYLEDLCWASGFSFCSVRISVRVELWTYIWVQPSV